MRVPLPVTQACALACAYACAQPFSLRACRNLAGMPGAFCSPRCEFDPNPKHCPQDVPTTAGKGVSADCLIPADGDADSGMRHCVLTCDSHAAHDPCPKGASCKASVGVSICTYDGGNATSTASMVEA